MLVGPLGEAFGGLERPGYAQRFALPISAFASILPIVACRWERFFGLEAEARLEGVGEKTLVRWQMSGDVFGGEALEFVGVGDVLFFGFGGGGLEVGLEGGEVGVFLLEEGY